MSLSDTFLEKGGSEFLEFCSVIADKVALKGFQGYRAQLDNKSMYFFM